MALLSDAERKALNALWMSEASRDGTVFAGLTKADIRAAINGIDQWVEDNQASFNAAIPQPARVNLTAKQKARALMYVVRRRYEVS